MSQLKDIPTVLRKVGPLRFVLRVWGEVNDDNVFGWAAALAYSWLFAVFPFFIFLMTLTPYLPAHMKDQAVNEIDQLVNFLPKDAAETITKNLADVLSKPRTGLLSVGLFFTIWAASGGMMMTMQALDRAHDVLTKRSFFSQRLTSVLLTIAVASLVIAVVVLLPIGTLVIRWIHDRQISWLDWPTLLAMHVARYAFSLGLMILILALIYHFGTNLKRKFHLVTPGSLFSIAVWLILGFVMRIYVDHFASYSKTYGAIGGVVILLTFFYVDALVLLIGAEIDSECDAALSGRRNDGTTPLEEALPKKT